MEVWLPSCESCDDSILFVNTPYSELYAGNIHPSRIQTHIRVPVRIYSTNEDKELALYCTAPTAVTQYPR